MTGLLDTATDLTFVPQHRAPRRPENRWPGSRTGDPEREIVVRTGDRWRPGDATRLLRAVHRSLDGAARLTLEHTGAGGISLLLAAAAEHPGLRVREVSREGGCPPVRIRPVRWVRQPLAPARVPVQIPAGHGSGPAGEPQAVAITGGLGGIGLDLAWRLGRAGHPLWLIDRRPVSALPVPAQHLLAALAARVRVVVSRSDVTDRPPSAPFPVGHLVHAAGELDLCPVRELSPGRLERAAPVKAAGLANWVSALAPAGLRSVVAFGSVESRRPHPLFAGYALANELLRREAGRLRREHPGIRIVTAEWSLWSGVGMAAQSAEPAAGAGFAVVPPDWGGAATHALLHGRQVPPEVVLGGPQSSPERPVRAIAGVGGSAHSCAPAVVDRLLRLCRPAAAARDPQPPPPGPVARAVVHGRRVGVWASSAVSWDDLGGSRP